MQNRKIRHTDSESWAESQRIQAAYQDALRLQAPDCKVHYYARLNSTQDKALELAKQGAAHGSLIIAGRQQAGRGRHQRLWWHDAHNGLACTVIVRPRLAARSASGLVFAAALALRQTLLREGVDCQIKWPNDLVVVSRTAAGQQQQHKLAGILSQASLRAERLNYALIGLGLNVNTAADDFADSVKHASSLFLVSGKKHNKYNVLSGFCVNLERRIQTLVQHGLAPLLDDMRACSATLGERVMVQIDGLSQQVQALDFAESGALIVRLDSGETRYIFDPL